MSGQRVHARRLGRIVRTTPVRVDRCDDADVDAVVDHVAVAEAETRATQRGAVHVGAQVAEGVLDEAGEPGEPVLGRQVGGAVDRRDVLEHRGLDRGVGQRRCLEFDDHLVGRVERHREVLAVELVAVRQDGDQVATGGHARQPGGEVALVALREDRALTVDAHRRPVARVGVAGGRGRATVGRRPLLGGTGVVDVDDEIEVRYGFTGVGVDDDDVAAERQRVGGRGMYRRRRGAFDDGEGAGEQHGDDGRHSEPSSTEARRAASPFSPSMGAPRATARIPGPVVHSYSVIRIA